MHLIWISGKTNMKNGIHGHENLVVAHILKVASKIHVNIFIDGK